MRRRLITGTIAALCTVGAVVAIYALDRAQEPPTDNADAIATLAALVGAAIWFAFRWVDTSKAQYQLIRAAAAGIAIGAVVTGLVSVVYDPWTGQSL